MMDDATFSNMMDGQAQPFSFSLFDPTTSPVNGVNSNNNTEDPSVHVKHLSLDFEEHPWRSDRNFNYEN